MFNMHVMLIRSAGLWPGKWRCQTFFEDGDLL